MSAVGHRRIILPKNLYLEGKDILEYAVYPLTVEEDKACKANELCNFFSNLFDAYMVYFEILITKFSDNKPDLFIEIYLEINELRGFIKRIEIILKNTDILSNPAIAKKFNELRALYAVTDKYINYMLVTTLRDIHIAVNRRC